MGSRNINILCLFPLSFLFLLLIQSCFCLFEDQVGKFDWKKSVIGKARYAEFSRNKLLVATERNVLACLSVTTGNILWRHVMEDPTEYQVHLLDVSKELTTVVGGKSNWFVRRWDISTGSLIREWTVNLDRVISTSYWSILNDQLIYIAPVGKHIEVQFYDLESGESTRESMKLSTPWLNDKSKCIISKSNFICIVNSGADIEVKNIDVMQDKNDASTTFVSFPTSGSADIFNLKHDSPSAIIIQNSLAKIIHFNDKIEVLSSTFSSDVTNIKNENGNRLFQLEINIDNPEKLLRIKWENEYKNDKHFTDIEYPKGLGAPYILSGICKQSICDLLLSSIDQALIMVRVSESKVLWIREEALSDIVSVEFVELPVSELDASIENEFRNSSQDILSMFLHRIFTQTKQFSNLFFGSQLRMNNGLVRDDFGLHKIILLITKIGKIYAIDTLSGHVIWSYRLPHVTSIQSVNGEEILLFVQRTARYSPLPAQYTLLAQDELTGNTILFQFDPITGFSSQGIVKLDKKVKQAMLLHCEDENHLKPFIIINSDDSIEVYPKEARKLVKEHSSSIYLYIIDENNVSGYSLKSISGQLQTSLHWNFSLKHSTLVAISTRPVGERVHSQGRVLPDRSVYYKYVNPNLIALATITEDVINKQVLTVHLIDGITGFVIYSVAHKKAKGPFNLVHSENWVVYTFFNERFRRWELVALELYEGHVQSNSTVFSSYAVSQLPQVQVQSYIIPALPIKVTVTLTERGITNKCLLVALSNGAVIEIPWIIIQPKFADIPCGPEESCFPYLPEIKLHPEATINYNQTLLKIEGISVASAKLESTSHILVYGLDIFYTRVAPSKTFDVLKEDFDHKLIVLVLIGLIATSYITKSLASRKAIKQAWK